MRPFRPGSVASVGYLSPWIDSLSLLGMSIHILNQACWYSRPILPGCVHVGHIDSTLFANVVCHKPSHVRGYASFSFGPHYLVVTLIILFCALLTILVHGFAGSLPASTFACSTCPPPWRIPLLCSPLFWGPPSPPCAIAITTCWRRWPNWNEISKTKYVRYFALFGTQVSVHLWLVSVIELVLTERSTQISEIGILAECRQIILYDLSQPTCYHSLNHGFLDAIIFQPRNEFSLVQHSFYFLLKNYWPEISSRKVETGIVLGKKRRRK